MGYAFFETFRRAARWCEVLPQVTNCTVFAVFHKYPSGSLEWIGAAETEERATLLARMSSRDGHNEVIVVENGANGRTEHRFTFRSGEPLAPVRAGQA